MIPNREKLAVLVTDVYQTLGLDDHKERRKKFYLKLGSIAAGIVIIVAIIFQMFMKDDAQNIRFTTAEATRGKLTVIVTATGTLEPVNQVDVGSEVSGTIKTVLVDYNDRVKQGQMLAVMNTDQLQARVKQAEASLALADLMQVPFVFNTNIVAIAFIFSAAVGVIFGYFPARKAARLDPIDALRHE